MNKPDHEQSDTMDGAPPQESSTRRADASTSDVTGSTASGQRDSRSRRLLSRSTRRTMWAVAGFLIASLVLPAATKQWSDRSDELQLKRDLVSKITQDTTDLLTTAECVVSGCTINTWMLQRDPTGQILLEAQSELNRLARDATAKWRTSTEVIDVLLRTYFPESELLSEWDQFSATILAFERIGRAECGAAREADMALLRAELPHVGEGVWHDLVAGIGPDCLTTPSHWPPAYGYLALALLEHRQSLTDQIVRANAVGYSSGWRDVLDDLYPL